STGGEEDEADVAAARAQLRTASIEEVPEEVIKEVQAVPEKAQETQGPPATVIAPEHQYRNAKDAAYTPPSTKNVGAQDKAPTHKRAEPAYKTLPPVHNPAIAATVFQRS